MLVGCFNLLGPQSCPPEVGYLGAPIWYQAYLSLALTPSSLSPCRDVALSVAALSFNLWFTKLSCKDFWLVSASAVALGMLEVSRFPEGLSSHLPEPGDLGAAALHAQQIHDARGAGVGKQQVESISKSIAGG